MAVTVTTSRWLVSLGNTTDSVATVLVAQGLNLVELCGIDPEDMKTLCSSARRPGGVHNNGDANLVTNVPTMLQLKLIVTVCAAHYYDTVGCTITHAIMTWGYVKQFKALKELVTNWKE